MHAFIDESKRGEYALCAVMVASGDLAALRKQMKVLRPPGTPAFNDRRREEAGTEDSRRGRAIGATSRIYVMSSRKVNERQARDVTLAAALRDLAQMPVTKLALVTGLGAVGTDTYRLLQSAVAGHPDFAGRPLGARLAPAVLRRLVPRAASTKLAALIRAGRSGRESPPGVTCSPPGERPGLFCQSDCRRTQLVDRLERLCVADAGHGHAAGGVVTRRSSP